MALWSHNPKIIKNVFIQKVVVGVKLYNYILEVLTLNVDRFSQRPILPAFFVYVFNAYGKMPNLSIFAPRCYLEPNTGLVLCQAAPNLKPKTEVFSL